MKMRQFPRFVIIIFSARVVKCPPEFRLSLALVIVKLGIEPEHDQLYDGVNK